jgi:hypothetical protein
MHVTFPAGMAAWADEGEDVGKAHRLHPQPRPDGWTDLTVQARVWRTGGCLVCMVKLAMLHK